MKTKKITFTLPHYIVKDAEAGLLLGDFNNWELDRGIPLTKNAQGDLSATVELVAGEAYQYRYFLSNGCWENDDSAHNYQFSGVSNIENCVIYVTADGELVEEKIVAKKKVATKKVAAVKEETKVAAPKKATSKTPTAKDDDLTKIEGIGKQIAALLIKSNIKTFAGLSKSSPDGLKQILNDAGSRYSFHNPATWPKQADLAAKGKIDELKTLQKELKGGKVAK